MNTDLAAASQLAQDVVAAVGDPGTVLVAVCPPFISLDAVFGALRGSVIRLGAQNMHHADAGAYTGEVSAPMLRSVGCDYVILGHSERRQYFGATDARVNAKTKQALANELTPIVCVSVKNDVGVDERVVRARIALGVFPVEIAPARDGEARHCDESPCHHAHRTTLLDTGVAAPHGPLRRLRPVP